MYEQFALAIAYSNQSSIGLLSNTVLMISSIYYACCIAEQKSVISTKLVRPFNILLKLKNTHYFHEKMLCTYEFRHRNTRFSGLEIEYNRLKRSIDGSKKITIQLKGYRVAFKRLVFYIALSRWHIINEYQNPNTCHIFSLKDDDIIVEGEIKELDTYLGLWEKSMKSWAIELFSNHNLDIIITKWCNEYSNNITSVVLYLQAEKNSRLETGTEPDAPQILQDGHEGIVNSSINSDDGMDAEDDDGGDQSSRLERKLHDAEDDDVGDADDDDAGDAENDAVDAEDDDAGDLIGNKKSKRQSSR
jgi:hypothetical protein